MAQWWRAHRGGVVELAEASSAFSSPASAADGVLAPGFVMNQPLRIGGSAQVDSSSKSLIMISV